MGKNQTAHSSPPFCINYREKHGPCHLRLHFIFKTNGLKMKACYTHTVQADEDALCQAKHALTWSWAVQREGCGALCIAIFNFSLTTLTSPNPPTFPAFSAFYWKAMVWPSDGFKSPILQLRASRAWLHFSYGRWRIYSPCMQQPGIPEEQKCGKMSGNGGYSMDQSGLFIKNMWSKDACWPWS